MDGCSLACGLDGQQWRPRAVFVFADPIRPEIPGAIRTATEAGIQTMMVTGDHPATALSIAREAGSVAGPWSPVPDLDAMTDEAILWDPAATGRGRAGDTPAQSSDSSPSPAPMAGRWP